MDTARSAKPDHGYDFASVASDLLGFIQALGLDRPIIAGHSWGGDVALEFAVAYPPAASGLCFVDGGMVEPSARYQSLEEARVQMAPPVLTGMTVDHFLERIRNGNQARMMTPRVEKAVLANFAVQEDNTIRPQLSRENHIRIIEALWDHHPPQLYPRFAMSGANPARPDGQKRRRNGTAGAKGSGHLRCRQVHATEQGCLVGRQRSRRSLATSGVGRQRHT